MPSILELFQSSEKNINPRELDKTPFSDDSTKQIDSNGVYFKNDLYKFGTNYSKIKSDKETFIEQETSGIRVRSAVELNNPLLYGNEAIRIVNRTTSTLDSMKSATGGEEGDGGLIGKGLSKLTGGKVSSISQARDAVNSKLGIPTTPNPSRLTEDIIKISSSEPITKDNVGGGLQGTGVGAFLKSTGGGNPKTLGKQALGKGIGLAKDKLRGALFGEGQTGGSNDVEPQVATTTNERTYSDVNFSKTLPSTDGVAKDLEGTKLDLSLVSPIYGVTRPGSFEFGTQAGQFGKTEYAFKDRGKKDKDGNYTGVGFWVNKFAPKRKKSETPMADNLSKLEGDVIGMKRGEDKINSLTTADYDSIDANTGAYIKNGNPIVRDLIPFYIGRVGRGQKKIPFRAILTGITENVSPSWNSQKFLGNPFPFYTYTQVERSTSFNLKIVTYNATELSTNWEKIEQLTKLTYPSIGKSTLVNPPIIDFRLGDVYVNKVGFIETLTYTIPDNGVWEIKDNGYLPKFIDVAITIKFIEDSSVLSALYGFVRSKAAIEKIKEETIPTSTQGVAITGNNSSITTPGDVPNKMSNKVTVTNRGIVPVGDDGIQTTGMPSTTPQNKVKSTEPKGIAKTQTPIQAESGDGKLDIVQSAVVDKIEAETPLQAQSKAENELGLTPQQARVLVDFKSWNDTVDMISVMQLPEGNEFIDPLQNISGEPNSIYMQSTLNGHSTYWEVTADGRQFWLWEDEDRQQSFGGTKFAPGYNRNQIKG